MCVQLQRAPQEMVPPPGPPPSIVNSASNHFHAGRGGAVVPVSGPVNGGGMPPSHYRENHFQVSHQNGIIQLKLKDGIE